MCDGGCGKTRLPGGKATCPDCVLAQRRSRAPVADAPPAVVPVALPGQAVGVAANNEVASARDHGVRRALKDGPRTFEELLDAFHPTERWLTDQEARAALSRTLTRLKMKHREVRDNGDTWSLVA